MAILNASGRIAPDPADLPTFTGTPVRQLLTARTMYRFAGSRTLRPGSSASPNPHLGKWWFDARALDEIAEDLLEAVHDGTREQQRNVLAGPRTGLAVKQSWSNFAWFCKLTIKAGEQIECWSGPAAPQQDHGSGFWEGLLPGGWTQYLIYDLHTVPSTMIQRMPT